MPAPRKPVPEGRASAAAAAVLSASADKWAHKALRQPATVAGKRASVDALLVAIVEESSAAKQQRDASTALPSKAAQKRSRYAEAREQGARQALSDAALSVATSPPRYKRPRAALRRASVDAEAAAVASSRVVRPSEVAPTRTYADAHVEAMTVVQLKTLARTRGHTGYSRETRAQLLARLLSA